MTDNAPDGTTTTLECPYRRSLDSVVGTFLAGLRDRRIFGIRDGSGKVLVPPLEYDPDTSESLDEFVEVASTGEVVSWAWVSVPNRRHPLSTPFAWALIRLDGADSSILHAIDAGGNSEAVACGVRVRARWATEPSGRITDIACFELDDGAENTTDSFRSDRPEPLTFMDQYISLDYDEPLRRLHHRFAERLLAGRLLGHRCPSCGTVYCRPRGFCPLCAVETTEADEVEVTDRGILTQFTVVTPRQYHGQKDHDEYVLATVLFDGSNTPIGGLRLPGISRDEIRVGMRLQAYWHPQDERRLGPGGARGFGGGMMGVISHFRPTGEPDASLDDVMKAVL